MQSAFLLCVVLGRETSWVRKNKVSKVGISLGILVLRQVSLLGESVCVTHLLSATRTRSQFHYMIPGLIVDSTKTVLAELGDVSATVISSGDL